MRLPQAFRRVYPSILSHRTQCTRGSVVLPFPRVPRDGRQQMVSGDAYCPNLPHSRILRIRVSP